MTNTPHHPTRLDEVRYTHRSFTILWRRRDEAAILKARAGMENALEGWR
jgi:hypothetical protein